MKSLIDLKNELINGKLQNLYIFTGEENLIRRIYYEKIGEINGNLRSLESVAELYKQLGKKSLFQQKYTYLVYNDLEYLKQNEKIYETLIKLSEKNVIILVYEEIPEKGIFRKVFEDYITVFNKVSDDIAIKYVAKEYPRIDKMLAEKIAFNCNNSYNHIIEEVNKYKWWKQDNQDDALDAMTYVCLFYDKKIIPTPKEFADAFLKRDMRLLVQYMKILKDENILGYLPELYNTMTLAIYFKIYKKWQATNKAYEAGEYWGRIKEIKEFNISYTKNDLLDIRYLIYQLDLDIRSGKMRADLAWDWLIGVIL